MTQIVDDLGVLLDYAGAGTWEREFLFCNKRNLSACPTFMTEYGVPRPRLYRFDFALPLLMLAVEYEGGVGRGDVGHTSTAGIKRDIEKSRYAALLGWKVLRFTHDDVKNGIVSRDVDYAVRWRTWTLDVADRDFYIPQSGRALIDAGLAVSWERN